MTASYDRSLLPPCPLEFCVVSDTHYMLDPGDPPLEFESRRRQSGRVAAALRRVAACEPAFVLHLGDLVQPFPGSADFDRAVDEAQEQIRTCGIRRLHVVAGNHDVGDKPDPTMPAPVVDAASLARHEARFGRSWYSAEYAVPGQGPPLAVVAVNSQILNTGLEAEAQQRQWLEAELRSRANQGARVVLALHLPPFLTEPGEPGLGHYDNVAEPARGWLLALLRRYPVELLLAGHVHWTFSSRLHGAAYRIAPSTSFTRPGFGHLFASGPAPERGRDDAPKLGFLLCRVFADRIDVHPLRTGGAEAAEVGAVAGSGRDGGEPTVRPTPAAAHLLTPLSSPTRACGLGVTLTHPLTWTAQVPLTWPSAVRQPARNDYPLLACQELGVAGARVPLADFGTPEQRGALTQLRRGGVRLQALELWEGAASQRRLGALGHAADVVEIQLAGARLPDEACLDYLRGSGGRQRALCPILPGQTVPGKQHPRTRTGYTAHELADLDRCVASAGVHLDAALCRVEAGLPPWPQIDALRQVLPLASIGRLDLLLTLPGADEAADARWLTEALFAARLLPGVRAFVDPLIDLDRTMDTGLGLLDGRCNPRPTLAVARCLNALLFREEAAWDPVETPDAETWALSGPHSPPRLVLHAPEAPGPLPPSIANLVGTPRLKVYDLAAATSIAVSQKELASVSVTGPVLLKPVESDFAEYHFSA